MFANPLAADELSRLLDRYAIDPIEIVATRSTPYRKLGLAEKELDRQDWIDLMSEHPALIKRPLFLGDTGFVSGLDKSSVIALWESDSRES